MQDISAAFASKLRAIRQNGDNNLNLIRTSGITDARYELSKVSATACLTVKDTPCLCSPILIVCPYFQLLWQFGDRHYNAKRWAEAADWFLSGTHTIFDSMARASGAKCFRKAALCYIQQRNYSKASATLRHCPTDEAATHYVMLLTHIRQGAVQLSQTNHAVS